MSVAPNEEESGRQDFRLEPEHLSRLVSHRLGILDGGRDFARFRFHRPLAYSVKMSIRYGIASSALSVLVIAGGLASSALATADGANDTLIATLGLAIAVLAAINRLWRPGVRAVARHRTANALRHEGWAFVLSCDAYEELSPGEASASFVDAVERINRAVEAIDESDADTPDDRSP